MFTLDTSQSEILATQIINDVFVQMLRLDVHPLETPPTSESSPYLAASISIGGAEEGDCSLQCDPAVARKVAARLLRLDENDLAGEDVADALGELINMIGGNLKAIVSKGLALSTPRVEFFDAAPESDRQPNRQAIGFISECGPFWVCLPGTLN